MASRALAKKRRYRRNKFTIPVALALPVGIMAVDTYNRSTTMGGWDASLKYLLASMTGVNLSANPNAGRFNVLYLKDGLLPLGLGMIVHKLAGRLGINSALSRTGLPIIRI